MISLERIGFIKRLLSEAAGSLEKGDAVQSSEKLYKAAEEHIKTLAEHLKLEEVKEAEGKRRWAVAFLETLRKARHGRLAQMGCGKPPAHIRVPRNKTRR